MDLFLGVAVACEALCTDSLCTSASINLEKEEKEFSKNLETNMRSTSSPDRADKHIVFF